MPQGQYGKISYCFQCMGILKNDDTVCPHCGQNAYEVKENERALLPGTVLKNTYLIGKVIGEGGFGITYMGLDLNLNLKVAIKEYFPASFASRSISSGTDSGIRVIQGEAGTYYWRGLEDYAKEANRLSQFASLPGIISVLNFFYENNTAYMIMDFVDGITLKDYLKQNKGKLPWRKTLELLHPVILSLMEVHKAGIIHRDISPDNIMMSKSGEMVLIDFGAARKVNADQKKTVILKKGYAPLEQYQSDGNQGVWSDVYSFCATIYRIIGGTNVPDALAIAGGHAQIASLKTLSKDIPDFLDKAVRKGMENEISARIQNMEELEGYLYKGKRVTDKISQKTLKTAILALSMALLLTIAIVLVSMIPDTEKPSDGEQKALSVMGSTEPVEKSVANDDLREMPAESPVTADNASIEAEIGIDAEYEALADTQNITYENVEGGIAITGVDYSATEVVIPGEIDGHKVKELRNMSPNATSVVIKNGMERIVTGAFRNCVYLESVYIPASITVIEDGAFENCILLKSIIVSEHNSDFYSEEGKLYSKDGRLIFG